MLVSNMSSQLVILKAFLGMHTQPKTGTVHVSGEAEVGKLMNNGSVPQITTKQVV